jgi:hypothetical protein
VAAIGKVLSHRGHWLKPVVGSQSGGYLSLADTLTSNSAALLSFDNQAKNDHEDTQTSRRARYPAHRSHHGGWIIRFRCNRQHSEKE